MHEWPSLTEAERLANSNYSTHEKVMMDLKSLNKGSYWAGTIGNIKRARLDIADEGSEEMRSGSW
eukprot:11847474-Prorocentrum_lima.AAC.1